ncbi:MAG: hypothetical protein J6Y33_01795 [Prevotella sp.]|nr:hypothetical protein [Prevotella sp.]
MSENVLELNELEELKATYNLMDERLDGQEIVSDEQLREVMMRKFGDMRQNAKEWLIWMNVVFVPVLLWDSWTRSRLTLLGIVLLAVYWVASLVFKFVILRKTKKEDYGSYDLNTLVEKESRYSRNIMWGNIVTLLFFVVYFVQMLWSDGMRIVLFFGILLLLLLIAVFSRKLTIKYKYNGQSIDPATGKPRVLKSGKWLRIVGYSIMAVAGSLWLVGATMSIMSATGLYGLINALSYLPLILATVTLILGLLHQKGKISVSRRLLIVLAVMAILIGVSVAGIAMLNDFSDLVRSGGLLMVVCFSMMGLEFHKQRKM